jgi:hypothetical protein
VALGLAAPVAQAKAPSGDCGTAFTLATIADMAEATWPILVDHVTFPTPGDWAVLVDSVDKNSDDLVCYRVHEKHVPGHDGAQVVSAHDNTAAK